MSTLDMPGYPKGGALGTFFCGQQNSVFAILVKALYMNGI
jgi:hypothetical protein